MRAQSEGKADLAKEAVGHGERAVEIFERYLPADHYSVKGSMQNLARYREASASIGRVLKSGSADATDLGLPEGHPADVQHYIERSRDLCARHDYEAALASAHEAERRATTFAGEKVDLLRMARAQMISVLRRHCSYLLGEPTGNLPPVQSMMMQLRARERMGLVEDENTRHPPISVALEAKLQDLLGPAIELVQERYGPNWRIAAILGREPINLPSGRLAGVRYSPIATKFPSAVKRRDGHEPPCAPQQNGPYSMRRGR
jgi:hypothetical protein